MKSEISNNNNNYGPAKNKGSLLGANIPNRPANTGIVPKEEHDSSHRQTPTLQLPTFLFFGLRRPQKFPSNFPPKKFCLTSPLEILFQLLILIVNWISKQSPFMQGMLSIILGDLLQSS
jgi:hypothetical protein